MAEAKSTEPVTTLLGVRVPQPGDPPETQEAARRSLVNVFRRAWEETEERKRAYRRRKR